MIQPLKWLILGCALVGAIAACDDDSFINEPSAQLTFSTDTVFFDTLFPTLSTATKRLKAFNPHDQSIKVEEVELMGGASSVFRVNINGQPTPQVRDLTLRPSDSLFVFVELEIDQSNAGNTFLVQDSLRFRTNGTDQYINLTAIGRQVIIHRQAVIDNDQLWTPDTPHLIVDYALVDSNTTLTLPPGTEVFSTGKSRLLVQGSLKVKGQAEEPVTFEGARPEPQFDGEPGQWQGIRLLPASKNNQIEHAIITEGNVGLQVDSFASNEQLKLRLRSTRISDMANVGLAGFSTTIVAQNSIISDCCGNLVAAQDGGEYLFIHCTLMATSCICSPDGTPVVFENDPSVGRQTLTINLLNSIVYGPGDNAYDLLASGQEGQVNAAVQNSLVKVTDRAPEVVKAITDTSNILNQRPVVESECMNDFNPTKNAPGLDSGLALDSEEFRDLDLDKDFADRDRSLQNPDIGALEFKP